MNLTTQNCYCGTSLPFNLCCEPFISQRQKPATPEQLMRSRYSAFNIGNVKYLVDTISEELKEHDDFIVIQKTINETKWLGLKIIESIDINSQTGFVEFVAFFSDEINFGQLHEKSLFKKLEGNWLYTSGEQLPPIKIGRNDICFCNSGKKFKKCHAIKKT